MSPDFIAGSNAAEKLFGAWGRGWMDRAKRLQTLAERRRQRLIHLTDRLQNLQAGFKPAANSGVTAGEIK